MKIANWIDLKFKENTPKEIIDKKNELFKEYKVMLDSDGCYYEKDRASREDLLCACIYLERYFGNNKIIPFLEKAELHITSDDGFHHWEPLFPAND